MSKNNRACAYEKNLPSAHMKGRTYAIPLFKDKGNTLTCNKNKLVSSYPFY